MTCYQPMQIVVGGDLLRTTRLRFTGSNLTNRLSCDTGFVPLNRDYLVHRVYPIVNPASTFTKDYPLNNIGQMIIFGNPADLTQWAMMLKSDPYTTWEGTLALVAWSFYTGPFGTATFVSPDPPMIGCPAVNGNGIITDASLYMNVPTGGTLAPATVGELYLHQFTYVIVDSALSARVPVFSLVNGTIPPGLSLDAAGLLTGIPTTPGLFTFTVQALDDYTAIDPVAGDYYAGSVDQVVYHIVVT
jgi:hypothetical protein